MTSQPLSPLQRGLILATCISLALTGVVIFIVARLLDSPDSIMLPGLALALAVSLTALLVALFVQNRR